MKWFNDVRKSAKEPEGIADFKPAVQSEYWWAKRMHTERRIKEIVDKADALVRDVRVIAITQANGDVAHAEAIEAYLLRGLE